MVELGSEIKISDSYFYVLIYCIMLLLMRVIKFHASGSNLIVFEDQKEIHPFNPMYSTASVCQRVVLGFYLNIESKK